MNENREYNKKRDARERKGSVDVDMNPMVDLAFLLLTFFMLTTTFAKPQAMELVMPVEPDVTDEEQEQPIKESHALSLVLQADDEIQWFRGMTEPSVQSTDYSKDGLRDVLLQANQEMQEVVVFIKPSPESTFKNLVDVLDELNITQTRRYAIVDLTEQDLEIIAANN